MLKSGLYPKLSFWAFPKVTDKSWIGAKLKLNFKEQVSVNDLYNNWNIILFANIHCVSRSSWFRIDEIVIKNSKDCWFNILCTSCFDSVSILNKHLSLSSDFCYLKHMNLKCWNQLPELVSLNNFCGPDGFQTYPPISF